MSNLSQEVVLSVMQLPIQPKQKELNVDINLFQLAILVAQTFQKAFSTRTGFPHIVCKSPGTVYVRIKHLDAEATFLIFKNSSTGEYDWDCNTATREYVELFQLNWEIWLGQLNCTKV